MVVCATCRREMRSVHMGRPVRWRRHWCLNGDEYACPQCGRSVIVDFAREGYDDRSDLGEFIEMQEGAVAPKE